MLKDEPFTLAVAGLAKSFGQRVLWSDLSFTLPSGAMCVVTGASGSGKTTLLNCIGRLENFDAGTIRIGPTTFNPRSKSHDRTMFKDTLGFLFQNYGLVESWTVTENLEIAVRMRHDRDAPSSEYIAHALARVGMDGREKTRIYTLSGGEQQRVALARLMLKQPSLILADEPTSALDTANADLVMDILAEQAGAGALVMISTHSGEIAARCGYEIDLADAPNQPEGCARPRP